MKDTKQISLQTYKAWLELMQQTYGVIYYGGKC